MPSTPKATAKLQPRLGVKIHYLYYWSDVFLDAAVEGTSVPVRYDPFDAGQAYAFVKGRWVRCLSEHHAAFAGRSEREIQLASAELRRRQQRHGQQFPLTARKLADFLASLDAEEVLLEQRLRDAEAGALRRPPTSDLPSAAGPRMEGAGHVALPRPTSPGGDPAVPAVALVVYGEY